MFHGGIADKSSQVSLLATMILLLIKPRFTQSLSMVTRVVIISLCLMVKGDILLLLVVFCLTCVNSFVYVVGEWCWNKSNFLGFVGNSILFTIHMKFVFEPKEKSCEDTHQHQWIWWWFMGVTILIKGLCTQFNITFIQFLLIY